MPPRWRGYTCGVGAGLVPALFVLRSQFVTSGWGELRYRSRAFTEQGVAMLCSVLRSQCSVQVCVGIMPAFVQLRFGAQFVEKGLYFTAQQR